MAEIVMWIKFEVIVGCLLGSTEPRIGKYAFGLPWAADVSRHPSLLRLRHQAPRDASSSLARRRPEQRRKGNRRPLWFGLFRMPLPLNSHIDDLPDLDCAYARFCRAGPDIVGDMALFAVSSYAQVMKEV
jgi:hypothetical protein